MVLAVSGWLLLILNLHAFAISLRSFSDVQCFCRCHAYLDSLLKVVALCDMRYAICNNYQSTTEMIPEEILDSKTDALKGRRSSTLCRRLEWILKTRLGEARL